MASTFLADELLILGQTKLGETIFAEQLALVVCGTINNRLKLAVPGVLNKFKSFNVDRAHEALVHVKDQVSNVQGCKFVPGSYTTKILYGEMESEKIVANGPMDEAAVYLHAQLRFHAAKSGSLTRLPFEDDFLDYDSKTLPAITVTSDAMANAELARQRWIELVDNSGTTSKAGLLELVKKRSAEQLRLDSFWRVDEAFIKTLCNGKAEEILKKASAHLLPSKENDDTPAGTPSLVYRHLIDTRLLYNSLTS